MMFDLTRIIERHMNPASKLAAELQERSVRAREQQLRRAQYTSPEWLTVSAVALVGAPGTDLTDSIDDPLTITGAIASAHADVAGAVFTRVLVTDTGSGVRWSREPVEFTTFAGSNGHIAGYQGVWPRPSPYPLAATTQLQVDFSNPVADANLMYLTFCAIRHLPRPQFGDQVADAIRKRIRAGQEPVLKSFRIRVPFAGVNGEEFKGLESRITDDPMLVLGGQAHVSTAFARVYSSNESAPTSRYALINALFRNATPVAGSPLDNYQLWPCPLYVAAGGKIVADFLNGINGAFVGVPFDANFLCLTF